MPGHVAPAAHESLKAQRIVKRPAQANRVPCILVLPNAFRYSILAANGDDHHQSGIGR